MFEAIDRLLTGYEHGALSRRQLLSGLAALAVGGATSASAAPQATGTGGTAVRINHINLRVSNMQRSMAFYENLFGPGFREFPTMRPYDLGGGSMVPYMSLQEDKDVEKEGRLQYSPKWHSSLATKPGVWEHIAFEVDNFDADKTMATLKAAGVEATKAGDYIWTMDPDGALIQIVDAKSNGAKLGQRLKPIRAK
jgi:catechol 2,3-dioxygenase-like lactoylglutathione lyase family enzyme